MRLAQARRSCLSQDLLFICGRKGRLDAVCPDAHQIADAVAALVARTRSGACDCSPREVDGVRLQYRRKPGVDDVVAARDAGQAVDANAIRRGRFVGIVGELGSGLVYLASV